MNPAGGHLRRGGSGAQAFGVGCSGDLRHGGVGRVLFGRVEAGVAHERLDRPDVDSLGGEPGADRVAEVVHLDLLEARFFSRRLERSRSGLSRSGRLGSSSSANTKS